MKKTILASMLALALCLTGCTTMLENNNLLVVAPYEALSSGESTSALRVENYQSLVSAIFHLVEAGEEHGVLNLYNYTTSREVEADLTQACLEVVQEDPLGAYAVDYIKHDHSLIVSYYEANIYITYRRTPEQTASIVSVTGSSAIRQELRRTLTSFSSEAVLRISYFTEDEDYILRLAQQAYYDAPAAALGKPEMTLSFYPETGHQRIVEILLTYPDDPEALLHRSQELKTLAASLVPGDASALILYDIVGANLTVEEGTGRSSTYNALMEKVSDSEGIALAYQLLCDQAGISCVVVRGQLDGDPHFWNIISEDNQIYRQVDLSADLFLLTDEELIEAGAYEWDRTEYPACTAPATETPPDITEEAAESAPEKEI